MFRKNVAPIFRVEEKDKQETSLKASGKQTLMMEATYSSEMPVDFQWTIQHYIPRL
jgi:hypothetical protein